MIIARCKEERAAHRRTGERDSPACAELFRRAFDGDQVAWMAVWSGFEPLMRAWVGVQSDVEYDEVLQHAFLAFARAAPKRPTLLMTDDLSRVLGYLRRAVQTTILMLRRDRQPAPAYDLPIRLVSLDEADAAEAMDVDDIDADMRPALRAKLAELVTAEDEQIILALYFICGIPPREIVRLKGDKFTDVKIVNTIIQRLRRRLSKDPDISILRDQILSSRQNLGSPAFLKMSLQEDREEWRFMDEGCALEEDILLDYITGAASAEMRAAIEQSPACLAAAQRLAIETLPLLQVLYRITCPDVETLIAYHENRVFGTEQLVLHRHIDNCPLCQNEQQLLDAIDAIPVDPSPSVRKRIWAAFVSPLAAPQPLRGGALRYRAGELSIDLSIRKVSGRPMSWTVRGQVRGPNGQPAAGYPRMADLHAVGSATQPSIKGAVEGNGGFVFNQVPDGTYEARLLDEAIEIIISDISIGDSA